ncbi:MAG: thioredoxin family protein, partial [Calditrichia bacterium]
MKIILSIGLMLLLIGCGSNKSEKSAAETTNQYAVNFENSSFKEAQAKAGKENKVLFVDFYADWCSPCKRLDKMVYKDKEAGEFINSNFVSLKIDGEKGEGPQLMKKFNIPGYPTLILFDPQGNEIDRVVGFGGDKDEYVQTLKDYLQGKNTLNDYLARLKKDPGNVELNFTLAEKYLYRDISKANKYFLKVLELDPQNKS